MLILRTYWSFFGLWNPRLNSFLYYTDHCFATVPVSMHSCYTFQPDWDLRASRPTVCRTLATISWLHYGKFVDVIHDILSNDRSQPFLLIDVRIILHTEIALPLTVKLYWTAQPLERFILGEIFAFTSFFVTWSVTTSLCFDKFPSFQKSRNTTSRSWEEIHWWQCLWYVAPQPGFIILLRFCTPKRLT